jgi:hypothetical protein
MGAVAPKTNKQTNQPPLICVYAMRVLLFRAMCLW